VQFRSVAYAFTAKLKALVEKCVRLCFCSLIPLVSIDHCFDLLSEQGTDRRLPAGRKHFGLEHRLPI
jgi:hypothetical protein